MKIINNIANYIGYCVLIAVAIFIIFVSYVFLSELIKLLYQRSYLYWVVNTYKLKYLKKMNEDPQWLIHVRRQVDIQCPDKFKQKWFNKIDSKLEELRNEIISHGETPNF